MKQDMYVFQFFPGNESEQGVELTYHVDPLRFTAEDFQTMCRTFGAALTFQPQTLDEYFPQE